MAERLSPDTEAEIARALDDPRFWPLSDDPRVSPFTLLVRPWIRALLDELQALRAERDSGGVSNG